MFNSARSSPPAIQGRSVANLLSVAAFLSVAAAIAYRAVEGTQVHGDPSFPYWAFCDFRIAVYYPAVSFLAGGNPYDAVAYLRTYPISVNLPPYTPLLILMHLPLALLPVIPAAIVYFVVILCLTLVVSMMAVHFVDCEVTVARVFGVGALLLLSRPGQANLILGHVAATATIACYAALCWSRSRPWLAAAALALATFKPHFAGPLVLLMLARGDWRTVVRGLAIAALVTAWPTLVVVGRAGGPMEMLRLITSAQSSWSALPENGATASIIRLDVGALIGRLIGSTPSALVQVAIAALVLGAAALGVRRLGTGDANTQRLGIGLICVALLISSYHQAYDALLLTLPLMALAVGRWAPPPLAAPAVRAFLVATLAVPAVNYMGTYSLVAHLPPTSLWRLGLTSANSAALIAAFVVYVALAFRYGSDRSTPLRAEPAPGRS